MTKMTRMRTKRILITNTNCYLCCSGARAPGAVFIIINTHQW
jgi:hypothetical protein